IPGTGVVRGAARGAHGITHRLNVHTDASNEITKTALRALTVAATSRQANGFDGAHLETSKVRPTPALEYVCPALAIFEAIRFSGAVPGHALRVEVGAHGGICGAVHRAIPPARTSPGPFRSVGFQARQPCWAIVVARARRTHRDRSRLPRATCSTARS